MSRSYQDEPRSGPGSRGPESRRQLQQAAEEARAAGQEVAEEVRAEAESAAEAGKEAAAGRLENIVSALYASADELGRKQDRLGDAVRGIAGQVHSAAQHLREQDLGGLSREISDFARRNPGAFLAGAALLGFAVSRLATVPARQGQLRRGARAEGGEYGVS